MPGMLLLGRLCVRLLFDSLSQSREKKKKKKKFFFGLEKERRRDYFHLLSLWR
jgi:hypothetical protein